MTSIAIKSIAHEIAKFGKVQIFILICSEILVAKFIFFGVIIILASDQIYHLLTVFAVLRSIGIETKMCIFALIDIISRDAIHLFSLHIFVRDR